MKPERSHTNIRVKKIHFFFLIFSLLLLASLARWQIVEASKFSLIAKTRQQSLQLDSMRGSIYSNDGSTLAYSEPRINVNIWLPDLVFYEDNKLQTREEFLRKIAPIIETTVKELEDKIKNYTDSGLQNIPIAESLTKDKWEELQNLKTDKDPTRRIKGLNPEYVYKRIYPEGRLASHVLGLTKPYNNTLIGEAGLESRYNDMLKPIKGLIIQENDAKGQAITSALSATIEPQNGSSIYTTIDKKLQTTVQNLIKDGVEKYEAKSGTVIIADPKTGEIKALANFPDYDPNLREEQDPNAYGDLAVSSPYEIGSVGKIFTVATAIEKGLITPDTEVLPNGHQGCEKIHNDLEPICTWDKKPQPKMPVWQCFANSDNICFFHIAEKFNRKDFYDSLTNFGVGLPSAIDISGESYGNLKDYDAWNIGDVAAFSYGHGYLMNAVQANAAVASIANFGLRMKPMLVNKVIDGSGNIDEYKPTIVTRTVSRDTAETVVSMMRKNYERSTPEWHYRDLKNYDLAVKSGTALIANSTGYTLDINASFVGFDASPERSFIMFVRLERPRVPAYDRLAFYNVRPLWLDIFNSVKDQIGVPRK